jgi:hypothetical protein
LWPLFVHADSAATFSACKPAIFGVFFKGFMLVLIAIAAIVTPLGLYEGISAKVNPALSTFRYVQDTSPMGFGTPPRDASHTWSRICGALGKVPCPNDNNNAVVVENDTSLYTNYTTEWYDSRVPINVVETFQSGTAGLGDTVSNTFDIQYRSYVQSIIEDDETWNFGPQVANGTTRTTGVYQPLSSLLLNDEVELVEGLIVDMKDGGIGFRNHSTPAWKEYGSTWTEDILFVVPDSVCVDTNLTLDYAIPRTRSEEQLSRIVKLNITDRGGFVNLDRTYPQYNRTNVQEDPQLWHRAYVAAWSNNADSMAYMNVTSKRNDTLGTNPFDYLNSEINKTFPLYFPDGRVAPSVQTDPHSLSVSESFGDYFTTTDDLEGRDALYPNPFGLDRLAWSDVRKALHTTSTSGNLLT